MAKKIELLLVTKEDLEKAVAHNRFKKLKEIESEEAGAALLISGFCDVSRMDFDDLHTICGEEKIYKAMASSNQVSVIVADFIDEVWDSQLQKDIPIHYFKTLWRKTNE